MWGELKYDVRDVERDFDQNRGRVTRRRHGPWRELSSMYIHEVIENERMAKLGVYRYYELYILGTVHWKIDASEKKDA